MKQFEYEDKKWVLDELESGRLRRSIAFEFYYKHSIRYSSKKLKISIIIRRIERLFLDWEFIRDNYGMERLKLKGGNRTKNRKGRSKRTSINDLSENDRSIYEKIVEDILENHNIPKSEIIDRIKKEKDKTENLKGLTNAFKVNRTSIYYTSQKQEKTFLYNPNLIKAIAKLINRSRNSIGRDKAYITLKTSFNISSYIFRKHWEQFNYKSNYHIKYRKKPKEKKYKGIWTKDYVNFKYDGTTEDEIWYSDITYIKLGKSYKMALLIIDGFTRKIKFLKIVENRKKETIIEALKTARSKTNKWPDIFHTDHGIEYANYKVRIFLKKHGILQSMSPKGNSLANRPSEYFFSILKREYIYPFKNDITTDKILAKTLIEYKNWYHKYRVQRCLQNKTPYDYSRMMSNTSNVS